MNAMVLGHVENILEQLDTIDHFRVQEQLVERDHMEVAHDVLRRKDQGDRDVKYLRVRIIVKTGETWIKSRDGVSRHHRFLTLRIAPSERALSSRFKISFPCICNHVQAESYADRRN